MKKAGMTRTLTEQAEVERECGTLLRFFGATAYDAIEPLVSDGFLEVVTLASQPTETPGSKTLLSVDEQLLADGTTRPPTLLICLLRSKHVGYLLKGLRGLGSSYVSLDASRP